MSSLLTLSSRTQSADPTPSRECRGTVSVTVGFAEAVRSRRILTIDRGDAILFLCVCLCRAYPSYSEICGAAEYLATTNPVL